MQKFQDYLVEDKNTHLEHLEDEIINNGSQKVQNSNKIFKVYQRDVARWIKVDQQSQLNGMVHQLYFVVSIQRMVDSLLVLNLYSIKHLK